MIVNVYTKSACVQCDSTKRHLKRRGIEYTEQPLEGENLDAAVSLGFRTAPVVVVSSGGDEQAWDGYRPDRIDNILKELVHEEAS